MMFSLPNGNQITHPDLVAALIKPGDAILATLTPQKADAWHLASCIPGEAGELFEPLDNHENGYPLDRANLIEELGDIEFYVQGLRANTGISYGETQPVGWQSRLDYTDLPKAAADVFDVVKKWVIYNKPFDREALVVALARLELVLAAIRKTYGVTREETLAGNVSKLGVRYAGLSYSDAAAQQRADKAETVH